jgi:hypothetical protein
MPNSLRTMFWAASTQGQSLEPADPWKRPAAESVKSCPLSTASMSGFAES